jgi:hypothetical protein
MPLGEGLPACEAVALRKPLTGRVLKQQCDGLLWKERNSQHAATQEELRALRANGSGVMKDGLCARTRGIWVRTHRPQRSGYIVNQGGHPPKILKNVF